MLVKAYSNVYILIWFDKYKFLYDDQGFRVLIKTLCLMTLIRRHATARNISWQGDQSNYAISKVNPCNYICFLPRTRYIKPVWMLRVHNTLIQLPQTLRMFSNIFRPRLRTFAYLSQGSCRYVNSCKQRRWTNSNILIDLYPSLRPLRTNLN